ERVRTRAYPIAARHPGARTPAAAMTATARRASSAAMVRTAALRRSLALKRTTPTSARRWPSSAKVAARTGNASPAIACRGTTSATASRSSRASSESARGRGLAQRVEVTRARHEVHLEPDSIRVFEEQRVVTGRPRAVFGRVHDRRADLAQQHVHRLDV